MKSFQILTTEKSADYELLDSGEGEKLERFGKFVLARPDPQALWHKRLPASEWKKADGFFTDSWNVKKALPDKWSVEFSGLKFLIRLSTFKHVGIFPEQSPNWKWLEDKVAKPEGRESSSEIEILNLFGYTGGATLACAKAGAKVVHVDGSKVALTWARENAELSGLGKKPIRWILDDAHAFVKREIKRGRKYAGIIMDPPAFGHGPKNELWKIEEHLLELVDDCMKILDEKPLFFLINGYASGYSALAYENLLNPLIEKFGGSIDVGELAIKESNQLINSEDGQSNNSAADLSSNGASISRLLPCGIFARW